VTAPLPPPLDQADWDKAATEYAVGSLDRVRATAEKWVGTISTLMGLFGTVVIFAGPETFSDITGEALRAGLLIALALAAVLAGAAIVLGALAAQGSTRPWDNWNGATYAAYITQNGNTAARQLAASRWLGAGASAVVLGAGLVATGSSLDSSSTESEAYVLVVTRDGTAACGRLTSENGNVRVGGQEVADIRDVTLVPEC
jgi:hypothetical protein